MSKNYAILSLGKVIDKIEVENVEEDANRVDRFSEIFNSSFFCKDITDYKKVKLNSTWDGQTFSESDEERKEVAPYSVAFVSDNVIKAVVRVYTAKRYNLYKEAEVNGVSAIDVTDMDVTAIKTGMSWDGTSFTE
jgi:hypothetical protein